MSSQRRIEASRANGRLSKGPVTAEGKLRSSQNAIRHGLLAERLLVEGESEEELQQLIQQLYSQFAPANDTERDLVEQMIAATWRIRRGWTLETRTFNNMIEFQVPGDPLDRMARSLSNPETQSAVQLLTRYETRLQLIFQRALRTLSTLRQMPQSQEIPNEPNPICEHSEPAHGERGDPQNPSPQTGPRLLDPPPQDGQPSEPDPDPAPMLPDDNVV
jgi:hypothetical protein